MRSGFGKEWFLAPERSNKKENMEVKAVREILWRASKNDWFEYPMGLQLFYFRYPERYQ
jgi:hypothetical protein